MYKKIKANNYNIHFIKTDKYKTITIKINFKRKLKKEDVTIRNLLIDTLFSSSKKYPTKRLMEVETENLYGLSYRGFVFASGIYSILSLETTFLNDKYTEKGNTLKSIDFLADILLNPDVANNEFNDYGFNLAYNNLEDELLSLKENANLYSQIRLLELIDDPAYSMRSIGYLDDLKKIKKADLYNYYLDVIKNDNIDVFIVGNIDDKVIDYFKNKFKFESRLIYKEPHIYKPDKYHKKVINEIEEIDNSQSKLVIGFKLIDLTDFERRYVLNIYNYLLGGSADSKLFKNVREKESLCYSISSFSYPLTGLFTIKAGINASNYNKTLKLINKEIKDMEKGNIDIKDIENGKLAYINSLKELNDSPNGLLSLYMSKYYVKADSIANKIKNIKKVTYDDIINLSKKIKLDTIYLLKGTSNEE